DFSRSKRASAAFSFLVAVAISAPVPAVLPFTASSSSAAGASTWPPHSPRPRSTVFAGDRLLLQALQLRGPRHGPRTPPAAGDRFCGRPFTASSSSAAGASTWPPHSPGRGRSFLRATVYCFKLFSCGGLDMAPALPRPRATVFAGDRLLLQALQLRGPRHGPRTPPAAGDRFCGRPFTASSSS